VEREDLEDLIQNFGIAVLGKDQESADDVQPTADHSHVNIKALIDELFHPSSTTTTTTTTPATTSTQRLPIKAHELGWDLSPIDLVMANSVLEPVFSDDQKQRGARDHETSSYLTESPYLASLGLAKPPPRSGKSLEDAEISLSKGQLIDKPTLPVLDTRRANFLLVNGRKRSKTGRKLPNSNRSKSKDNRGSRPRFGQKTSQKTGHQQLKKKKKCEHDADDILWRETVSHQNFVTTSPHPFIRSDDTTTTETPMMDISPFLQPPAALSGISENDHHHHQEHQEESQEDSHQALLQSALGQVKADVISQQSRRHPPSGPRANKKGKFVVRGKIRFKNRKKKGRSSSSSVFQDKKSSANVFQAPRLPPQPSRRRGKKSDDIDRNHHVNHQHLSDEELEEVIFQETSSFSSDLTPQTSDSSSTLQLDRADSLQIQETKNTKFRPADDNSALPVTEVHRVQDEHIHHHLMMSVTRSSPSITGDCVTSGEGLHADLGSGCQVRRVRSIIVQDVW